MRAVRHHQSFLQNLRVSSAVFGKRHAKGTSPDSSNEGFGMLFGSLGLYCRLSRRYTDLNKALKERALPGNVQMLLRQHGIPMDPPHGLLQRLSA